MRSVTCTAPVNIAVVKYWGKRDEQLILPTNSSLSGTLHQDDLRTCTSAAVSPSFESDRLWLNGEEVDVTKSQRLQNVLSGVRTLAQSCADANALVTDDGKGTLSVEDVTKFHVHVVSENNFPTAAGLASSASGYACLTFTLAQLMGINVDQYVSQLTAISRTGSGSSCRSLSGGFVAWDAGSAPDGTDSVGRQVVDEHHWPNMHVLILIVSAEKKGVSSTSGMRTSWETSALLKHRVNSVFPERQESMERAIRGKEWEEFARLTMQDSNQFHAVALDTYPPIFYMNDVSRRIVQVITRLNAAATAAGKGTLAAYTFDAGPNAVLYLPEQHVATVLSTVLHYFPPTEAQSATFVNKAASLSAAGIDDVQAVPVPELMAQDPIEPATPGSLTGIIHTKIGPGPKVLDASLSLLNAQGLPKVSS